MVDFNVYVVILTTIQIAVQLGKSQTFGYLLTKAKGVTLQSSMKVFE